MLSTTVMYYGDKRIVGTGNVLELLLEKIPELALKLGGKDLETRDFIDAFEIRGPNYGDVVRNAIDKLVSNHRIVKKNIGSLKKPRYKYALK